MSYSEEELVDQKKKMHAHETMDDAEPPKKPNLKDFVQEAKKDKIYAFPISQTGTSLRQVQISKFKGKVRVDIREYYDNDGEWKPTKKGISLDTKQWKKFTSLIGLIDDAIEEMEE